MSCLLLGSSRSRVLKPRVSLFFSVYRCGLLITYRSVDGTKRLVTYKEWSNLIQASFEECYYVPTGMQSVCDVA